MRTTPILAALGTALLLSACTYVERTVPQQPAVVQAPPTVVTPAAPAPTVTVRPGY